MTIWHTLTSVAAVTASMGAVIAALQRMTGSGDERASEVDAAGDSHPLESAKFSMAIIALSAKLARSDGAVTLDEVEAFRRIMVVPDSEAENVRRLFNLAKQDVAGFEAYARQVGAMLDGDTVLARDILEALLVVAAADGVLHERENSYLATVSSLMGLGPSDYEHVRGLYFRAPMGVYEVLGLAPGASDREVKARHRMLVKEHHPDRLAGLGCSPEHVARAEAMLARINAAYDVIAKERGL